MTSLPNLDVLSARSMKRKIIISFLFAIPLYGFSQDLVPFTWLAGTWEMPRPKGGYRLETWMQKDSKTLSGKGLRVIGMDTTHLEVIELYASDGDVWYVPTVPDQNNAQPVAFKLVSSGDLHYVFENPRHDFPQRIAYSFKPILINSPMTSSVGDSMVVDVTDLAGEGIHFRFIRKK